MNKVIVGIIGLIIVIGLAFYFVQDDNTAVDQRMDEDTQNQEEQTQNTVRLRENSGGDTVTAERVVLAQPGYVVIYHVSTDSEVRVVGVSELLEAGEHTNVEIVLDTEVTTNDTIVATLHGDDGDNEYSEDDLPLIMNGEFATDVDVVGVDAADEDEALAENVEEYLDGMTREMEDEDTNDETSDADVVEFTISGENYSYSQDTITVQEGQTVRITFVNEGGLHDFVIDEFEGAQTERIQTGETETIEFVADAAGTYAFYCSVGQHRQLGMEGTFIVE